MSVNCVFGGFPVPTITPSIEQTVGKFCSKILSKSYQMGARGLIHVYWRGLDMKVHKQACCSSLTITQDGATGGHEGGSINTPMYPLS